MKKVIQVEVEDSGLNVLVGVANAIKAAKAAKAAGGGIPAEVMAAVAALIGEAADISHLAQDSKEDKVAFTKGCELGLDEVYAAIVG